jgi:CBS domain-containing protein/ribosome-associated translation inhibitor RaiA
LIMQKFSPFTDLSSKPLEDFISEPVVVGAGDPISDIIATMVSKKLYEIFVQYDNGFGVVNLRSILRAGEVSNRKLSTVAVRSPATTPRDPVFKAAMVMSGLRVKSLPITDLHGKLKGGISSATILQELVKAGSSRSAVSEIMTSRPTTIDFSNDLDKARSLMVEKDFDHLPITRDGKLVGLITSMDLIEVNGPTDRTNRTSKLPEPSSIGSVKVGGVMRDEPVICEPTDDSLQVLRKIMEKQRTAAVVVAGGAVRGIVTLRDYVKLLAVQPEPVGQPVYVVGLPKHDYESALAESKFRRSIESLSHVYPEIDEARATVKTFSKEKERKHFEVHVLIRMPKHQVEFREEGWSIEEVFENIGSKIKRLMTKPRDSPSRRRFPARAETAAARF